jgi:hypothetical protein
MKQKFIIESLDGLSREELKNILENSVNKEFWEVEEVEK